jgi:hypothetical protein
MTTVIYNAICIVLNRKIVYVITIAVSIIYPITTISSVDCFWQLNSVCWYIGFYALGNLFMDNEMDLIILSKTRWINVMIAVLLAISDFILCYFELNIGIVRWFGATMGIFAFTIISLLIGRCKCIEYLGRISLVILCVHGLVYRFWIKIISLLIKMEVDFLRGKFWCSIVVVVVTLMTCAAVYEVLKRTAPWMLGKRIN